MKGEIETKKCMLLKRKGTIWLDVLVLLRLGEVVDQIGWR